MSTLADIANDFPGIRYHAEKELVTWHPTGTLDDALADRIVEFVELEERLAERPFDRYADFGGLAEIHMQFGHTFRISERRRASSEGKKRVKSAFFSNWIIGFGMARLYEELMEGASIHVRAFHTREEAAEWLEVPLEMLLPEPGASTPFQISAE